MESALHAHTLGIFIMFAIWIGIFLLFRGVTLWYWRINIIIKNQEEQIALFKKNNAILEKAIKSTEEEDENTK